MFSVSEHYHMKNTVINRFLSHNALFCDVMWDLIVYIAVYIFFSGTNWIILRGLETLKWQIFFYDWSTLKKKKNLFSEIFGWLKSKKIKVWHMLQDSFAMFQNIIFVLNWNKSILTLVMLNLDMHCLCKQCRSRSVGFWRSQLIWIFSLPFSMWICINNLNEAIWLAEN